MHIALSRARKTLTIFYLDDLLHENLIKKDEDNTEMLIFGELYSLDKILKKQKKWIVIHFFWNSNTFSLLIINFLVI